MAEETLKKGSSERGGAPKPPPDPFYTLRPHAGDVTAVRYLNLGSKGGILSGTSSGKLSLWDMSSKRQTWAVTCSASVIAASRISCSSDTLAVQLRGGTVALWSLEAQKQVSSFSIQNPSFCRLALFPQDTEGGSALFSSHCFAVSDSNWGKVNIYDSCAHHLIQTLSVKESKSKGMCMCVHAHCIPLNGIPYVFGGFDDGSITLWDCRQPSAELTSLKLFHETVMCISFDSESLSGVCGSPTNTLQVFTVSVEQPLLRKKYSVELKNAGVGDVSVRQDSKIMASAGWDGRIRVFGWKKGKPLAILNYHSSVVHCISFSGPSALPEHSNLLICGSKDERISLWKLY